MDFQKAKDTLATRQHFFNPLTSSLPIYHEPENKIITLRNIHGPLASEVLIRPTKANSTGELLGVERLTPEQLQAKAYAPTSKSKIKVKDGSTFNLMDETERTNWNWVQYSLFITRTKEECLMSPMAVLYIEDPERDTELRRKKQQVMFDAERLVNEWTPEVRVNRARLLGQDLSYHTPGEVLLYLTDKARTSEQDALAILEVEKDQYRNERLELLRWQDAQLIEVRNGGSYYFGAIRIGADERSALAYILQRENYEIVDSLRAQFSKLQRPNLSGNVDVPQRPGAGLQASSTSANPPMVPPATTRAPAKITLGSVKTAAPLAYANLVHTIGEGGLAFLTENPDEELFQDLIRSEIRLKMQQAAQPAPVAAAVVPVSPSTPAYDEQGQSNAANVAPPTILKDEVDDLLGGDDENESQSDDISSDDTFDPTKLPLGEQEGDGTPDVTELPILGDDGQPLKGLALFNAQRKLRDAANAATSQPNNPA